MIKLIFVILFTLNFAISLTEKQNSEKVNAENDFKKRNILDEILETVVEYGPKVQSPNFYPARMFLF